MHVITQHSFGEVEQLVDGERPLPEPGPGEVRIRIRAASLNPVDTYIRQGRFGGTLPLVLGRDLAGTVDALGEGVREFVVGDAVYCYLGGRGSNGSHAEATCVAADLVARMPRGLSFEQAAALPVVGLTAAQCVSRARVRPGEAVFVAGGSGGVGSMALRLLREAGAGPVFTTAGGDASAAYLVRELGVRPEHVLRYRGLSREALRQRVLALNGGEPVPVALDFVGGAQKALCFEVAAVEGRVVSIVEEPADSPLNLWDETTSPLVLNSLEFHFIQLGARAQRGPRSTWSLYRAQLDALTALLESGRLGMPAVTVVGPLGADTARQAHRLLEAGGSRASS